MKVIEAPENYRHSPLVNPNLTDDYYYYYPTKTSYYERSPIGFQFSRRSIETPEPTNIVISILDGQYSIPSALSDLIGEINDSKYILSLEDNWDGFDAVRVEHELYKRAIEFILMYAVYIYKNHQVVIASPEINPCADGTIDLSWKTMAARMLINIKKKDDNFFATFYGYYTSNRLPFEGLIDMENVDKNKASWMTELK